MAFNFLIIQKMNARKVMSEGLFLTIIRPKTVDETALVLN